MRFSWYRNKNIIISVLLMMLSVQSFSLHAHISDGDDHHSSHVHSHILNGLHSDHLDHEHEEGVGDATLGTLSKQSHLIDLCIFILLIVLPFSLYKLRIRKPARNNQRLHYLLFFRPPLRAPPQ